MEIFHNRDRPNYEEVVSYGPKWWTEYREMDANYRFAGWTLDLMAYFLEQTVKNQFPSQADERTIAMFERMRKLWDVMRKGSSYVSDSSISSFLIGKSSYDSTEEEKKDAAERIENLSVTELTLITAYNGTESLELSEWTGDFNKRSAGILKEFYEVLMMYGFTYNSDDEVKLLNGTHELYTETEIE